MARKKTASDWLIYAVALLFIAPLLYLGVRTTIAGLRQSGVPPVVAGSTMVLIAVLAVAELWYVLKKRPLLEQLERQVRAIPPLEKLDGKTGRFPDLSQSEKGSLTNIVLLSIFSVPTGALGVTGLRDGSWIAALFLLIPAAAVGAIAGKIRTQIRKKRFGRSELVMSRAHVGEPLQGRLTIEKLTLQEVEGSVFRMTLSSIRRQRWEERNSGVRHSYSTTRTETSVLWTNGEDVPSSRATPTPAGLSVPVSIAIDADQQPTNDVIPDDAIYWQLEVRAALKGIDYYSRFDVPVFAERS